MADIELRTFPLEIRDAGDQPILNGYAAMFNLESQDLGGFVEQLDPGCFTRSLSNTPDICCFYNHDTNQLLGRTSSGTLKVDTDQHGLFFETQLPNTSSGNDCRELCKRADIRGCSFGFMVKDDQWTKRAGKLPLRTLKDVELIEVSPVVYPAYPQTRVSVRAIDKLKGMSNEQAQLRCRLEVLEKSVA